MTAMKLVILFSLYNFMAAFQTHHHIQKYRVLDDNRYLSANPCSRIEKNYFTTNRQSRSKIWSQYNNNDNNSLESNKGNNNPIFFSWLMLLILPATSMIFPQLLQVAKSLPPNSSEQFIVISTLFVTNRVYLYALSGTIVGLAALRGATDSTKLGKRITDLTEELLFRPSFTDTDDAAEKDDEKTKQKPSMIKSLNKSKFGESLDEISTETQALVLPIIVSLLLATSVLLLPLWNGPSIGLLGGADDGEFFALLENFQGIVANFLPKISQAWNIGLLALFTKSEIRSLDNELNLIPVNNYHDDSIIVIIEWALAIGITSLAFFFQQWPAQNFVNMSLAILVSRAIQLDKFPAIITALSLLTLYDATSVFLVPVANAMDTTSSMTTATTTVAANSAMGSVAIQRLTSSTFQPGLLSTKIGNTFGGSLGLGDAVFPSLLVNFVRRFDMAKNDEKNRNNNDHTNRISLFAVSMIGYFLGCFACEFAPLISSSGIPALVFIVPSMFVSVLVTSALHGELDELIQFDPKQLANEDGEKTEDR